MKKDNALKSSISKKFINKFYNKGFFKEFNFLIIRL